VGQGPSFGNNPYIRLRTVKVFWDGEDVFSGVKRLKDARLGEGGCPPGGFQCQPKNEAKKQIKRGGLRG